MYFIECHSVSFVMYISGAKFQEHCSNTSTEIFDSVFYCFTMSSKKINISEMKEDIPKRKIPFFFILKSLSNRQQFKANESTLSLHSNYLLLFFDLLLSFLFLFVTHWYAVFNLCSYSQCGSNCCITVRRWWWRWCRFWRGWIPPALSLSLLGSTTCVSLTVVTFSATFYSVTPQTLNKVLVIFVILTVDIKQEAVEWKSQRLVLGL